MRKKIIFRKSYHLLLICLVFLFAIYSCSEKSDETTKDGKTGKDITTFKETNEDLLSVDYKYFYEELSSGGEWIKVNTKDIGINIDPKKLSNIYEENRKFVYEVLGIKTGYAQTESEIFNLFVWRPSTELLNKEIKESDEQAPPYIPYNNGQWLNTDAGWYFKGATPQEEITSHYGRWAQDTNLGNVWLPGKTWAPVG